MPGESDAAKEAAAAREIPLGRMGRKWDIAMGVLFLASPAAGASQFALKQRCCRGAVPDGPRHRYFPMRSNKP